MERQIASFSDSNPHVQETTLWCNEISSQFLHWSSDSLCFSWETGSVPFCSVCECSFHVFLQELEENRIEGWEQDRILDAMLFYSKASHNRLIRSCTTSAMRFDRLIRIGENKQPKHLIRLLKKSANFGGVRKFDNDEVPSLHSQEPPNCWSLPLVTLASISIAFTKTADDKANQLLAQCRIY